MRNYFLNIESKIEATDSEEAINTVKNYLSKICSQTRVVSITDEGGERTFIEPSMIKERFFGAKHLKDK
jgi:hypothetical protein